MPPAPGIESNPSDGMYGSQLVANPSPFGPLEGFGNDARQVLTAAQTEAQRLGHQHIGTEHILLGLLDDDRTPVAQALGRAGISIASARHKVEEAVGATGIGPAVEGTTTATKRASRAVERAVRISHQRRSDVVTSRDILQGVLNVEGTAGQVLRGLGIDVDQLGAVAEHIEPKPTAPATTAPELTLRCSSCGEELGTLLRHHVVTARAEGGTTRQAQAFSCGSCGVVLGVGPA